MRLNLHLVSTYFSTTTVEVPDEVVAKGREAVAAWLDENETDFDPERTEEIFDGDEVCSIWKADAVGNDGEEVV